MDILFKECFENIPFGDKDDNGKQNKELTKNKMYKRIEELYNCHVSPIKNGFTIIEKSITLTYKDVYDAFMYALNSVYNSTKIATINLYLEYCNHFFEIE